MLYNRRFFQGKISIVVFYTSDGINFIGIRIAGIYTIDIGIQSFLSGRPGKRTVVTVRIGKTAIRAIRILDGIKFHPICMSSFRSKTALRNPMRKTPQFQFIHRHIIRDTHQNIFIVGTGDQTCPHHDYS